jgi:hypothetical protein
MIKSCSALCQLALGIIFSVSLTLTAASAWALGSTPVTVVNPADFAKALGVQHPVTFQVFFNDPSTGPFSQYVVPTTQRLIIEYAGGSCTVANASVDVFDVDIGPPSARVTQIIPVALPPISSPNVFLDVSGTFGHLVRIYVDPGTAVSIAPGSESTGTNGTVSCSATMTGQLIDVP